MFDPFEKVTMENLKPKPIDSIVNQGQANEVVNRRMYVGLYRDFIKRIQNIPLIEILKKSKQAFTKMMWNTLGSPNKWVMTI